MAKGNWNPKVIKPKVRCRYCGYVLKKNEIRYVGYIPCHAECADKRNLVHTAECTKMTRYLSEEEPTGEITITHEEATKALEVRRLTKRAIDPPLADGTRTDSKNNFVSPESRTDGTAGN